MCVCVCVFSLEWVSVRSCLCSFLRCVGFVCALDSFCTMVFVSVNIC